MLKSKQQVDRHVYHLLSKCSSLNERKSKGFEIAKLYFAINEFKSAESYVLGYLEIKNDCVSALLLLAKIYESLDDISAALRYYKSACKLSSSDHSVVHHCCQLALDHESSTKNLEFWSSLAEELFPVKKITCFLKEKILLLTGNSNSLKLKNLLALHLKKDESDSNICSRFMNSLWMCDGPSTAMLHSLQCINSGHHVDVASWHICCLDIIEKTNWDDLNNEISSELVRSLRVLCYFRLLKLSCATSCLSDLRRLLMNLNDALSDLSAYLNHDESSFFYSLGNVWLNFYGGVYAYRCLEESSSYYTIYLISQFYERTVDLCKVEAYQDSINFSRLVFQQLYREYTTLRIQAVYLVHQFMVANKNEKFSNVSNFDFSNQSWHQLIDMINQTDQKVSGLPTALTSNSKFQCFDYINGVENLINNDYLHSGDCLPLLMWMCAHYSLAGEEIMKDCTLSDGRLSLICKVVDSLFSNLHFGNKLVLPANEPVTGVRNIKQVDADQLGRLDIICFLLSSFLHLAIRSLQKIPQHSKSFISRMSTSGKGIGPDFLYLPICLLSNSSMPITAQRNWWSSVVKFINEPNSRFSNEAAHTRTVMQCGLNQLHLLFQRARCLENQFGFANTLFLIRIAYGLSRLTKFYSSEQALVIESWAICYWQTALRFGFYGSPLSLSESKPKSSSMVFCSGSVDLSSPRSNARLCTFPGSHSLFGLPSDYNIWVGVINETNSTQSLYKQWCNMGWLWCFHQVEKKLRFGDHGLLSTSDEKLFRFLVSLLDHDESVWCQDAYKLCGELLIRLAEIHQDADALVSKENQCPTTCLTNESEIGWKYLKLALSKSNPDAHATEVFQTSCSNELGLQMGTPVLLNVTSRDVSTPMFDPLGHNKIQVADKIPVTTSQIGHSNLALSLIEDCNSNNQATHSVHNNDQLNNSFPNSSHLSNLWTEKISPNSNQNLYNDLNSLFNFDDQANPMSTLISSWQSLITSLSCQLAETKAELAHNRQLNEQLSKQLSDTSKQLSDAINRFVELQESNRNKVQAVAENERLSHLVVLLESPIRELCNVITDLRRWLPEGMAAAVTAAINSQLTPFTRQNSFISGAEAAALMQLYNTGMYPHSQFHPTPTAAYHIPFQNHPVTNIQPSNDLRFKMVNSTNDVTPLINTNPTLSQRDEYSTTHSLPFMQSGNPKTCNYSVDRQTGFGFTSHGSTVPLASDFAQINMVNKTVIPNVVPSTHIVSDSYDQNIQINRTNFPQASAAPTHSSTPSFNAQSFNIPKPSETSKSIDNSIVKQTIGQFPRTLFSTSTGAVEANLSTSSVSSGTVSSPSQQSILTQKQSDNPAILSMKPFSKVDEWSCPTCLLQNVMHQPTCSACQTVRPGSEKSVSTREPETHVESNLAKFAPQSDSWECPTCMLHHKNSVDKCTACQTAKPGSGTLNTNPTTKPSHPSLFGSILTGTSGYVFGQPKFTGSVSSTQPLSSSKPIFSFTNSGKLSANSPSTTTSTLHSTSPAKSFTFGTPSTKPPSSKNTSDPLFSFGKHHTLSTPTQKAVTTMEGDAVFRSINLTQGLSSATTNVSQSGFTFSFSSSAVPKFGFSPQKVPVSSPPQGDTREEEDNVELVDDSKLTFKPVLEVMPERIEVRTGEENEEVIFCSRAKLYRWDSNNWCERGIGDLKLLRSPSTGTVRCVMRRDQVLKVCCNHIVGVGMLLKPMTTGAGRAWNWWAIDYSEFNDEKCGKETVSTDAVPIDLVGGRRETFAARFKTIEVAQDFYQLFMEAVSRAEARVNTSQKCLSSNQTTSCVDLDHNGDDTDSDVVVIEKPLKVTEEQLARARKLRLPDEFYSYENGEIHGESECLTGAEEAEEDALLETAVNSGTHSQSKENNVNKNLESATNELKPDSKDVVQTTRVSSSTTPPTVQASTASSIYIPQAKGFHDFSTLSSSLSKDMKPWGGTKNSDSTQEPSWGSGNVQLFAKSSPAKDDQTVEEHDPHYDPIVPLPKLVEAKSGEEEELCLFIRRCRVYRYTESTWKERGVGDVKVLVRPQSMPSGVKTGPRDVLPVDFHLKDVLRARILMRRDQVLKLCINQPVSSELPIFKPMGVSSGGNSLCWVGEDFSEGSGSIETLAIKFKHESDAQEFKGAVERAQKSLKPQ